MKKDKKKILFITSNLAGGGAERVIANFLENFDRDKVEAICLFYDSNHDYPVPRGIKTIELGLPRAENRLKRIAKLQNIIKAENPHIIYSSLVGVNIEVISAHVGLEKKPKLIISEHNVPSMVLSGAQNTEKRSLVRKLYPKADKIIAVSEGVKKDLIENFNIPPGRIQVIYNSIDIKKVKDLMKEKITEHIWYKEKTPIVINVASLKAKKAHQYLLKAFKIARNRVNCRLVILGKGERESELKQLAKELGVQNDVAFLGFQRNPFKFMANSSMFVLSSIREGLGNVIFEAMACGAPVISTDCPVGPREMIRNGTNGILVPIRDQKQMAESIISLIRNPKIANKISENAKKSISKFLIENTTKKYYKIFEA